MFVVVFSGFRLFILAALWSGSCKFGLVAIGMFPAWLRRFRGQIGEECLRFSAFLVGFRMGPVGFSSRPLVEWVSIGLCGVLILVRQ